MIQQPLSPRALYEEVAERLRQSIYKNALAPGSWIDEVQLAEEYGISRTPMREALKVLATEGLVTIKVRRGAYVTEVSDKDLTDVYHLLALLESDASAQAAQKATSHDKKELIHLHEKLKKSVHHTDTFFEVNEAFHLKILTIANNRWQRQMVQDLRKVMKLNRHSSLLKQGRMKESLAEHQAVLRAIVNGQATLAQQTMQAHFVGGLRAATPPYDEASTS